MATKVLSEITYEAVLNAQTLEQFANIAEDLKGFTVKKITSRDFEGFNGDSVESISLLCEAKTAKGTQMMPLPGSVFFNSKILKYNAQGEPMDDTEENYLGFSQWQELISTQADAAATEVSPLTVGMLKDIVVNDVEIVEEKRPHVLEALNKQNEALKASGKPEKVIGKYSARSFISYDSVMKAHNKLMDAWKEANIDKDEGMKSEEPNIEWDSVYANGVLESAIPNKKLKLTIKKAMN